MRRPLSPTALIALALLAAAPAQAGFDVKGSPPGNVTVQQTSDGGALLVRLAGGQLTVSEGIGLLIPGIPKNLKVIMLPGAAGPLTLDLDQELPGNLDLRVGDIPDVDFTGTLNGIGGSLKIKGGDGTTAIDLCVNHDLRIDKSLIVDMGKGSDTLRDNGFSVTVGAAAKLVGVNLMSINGDMLVGKNLSWNGKKDNVAGNLAVGGGLFVGGGVKYLGGPVGDNVQLAGVGSGVVIGRNLVVSFGDDTTGSEQRVALSNGARVDGKVSVKAGASAGGSRFVSSGATQIGKNLSIKFPKPGDNVAELRGAFGGKSVKYTGGPGSDIVTVDTGSAVALTVKMGAGNDILSIDADADDLISVKVDFGPGNDTLNIPLNPPYPTKIKNLP